MTAPLDPAEQAFRARCRAQLFELARTSGQLDAFLQIPVDRYYLPHVADEEAQEAADFLNRYDPLRPAAGTLSREAAA